MGENSLVIVDIECVENSDMRDEMENHSPIFVECGKHFSSTFQHVSIFGNSIILPSYLLHYSFKMLYCVYLINDEKN